MTDLNDPQMGELKHPLPVKGYSPQNGFALDTVNLLKESEERILRMLDSMQLNANYDKRWIAIARTHINEGYMAAVRAVFQPSRIKLPEDGQ